ncbi:MAG: hypothetical protein CMJ50_09545 [Planctomycetaceae bacterium]|nr:hypothetical protein [Planctomycetaceae bacterium]
MNLSDVELLLLRASSGLVSFGVNWLLQSTLLIAAGLLAVRALHRLGPAAKSAVYRTYLVAVVLCPLATFALSIGGVSGWTLDLPTPYVFEPVRDPTPASGNTNTVVASSDWRSGPQSPVEPATSQVLPLVPPEPALPLEDVDHTDASRHVTETIGDTKMQLADLAFVAPVRAESRSLGIRFYGLLCAGLALVWMFVTGTHWWWLLQAWRMLSRLQRSAVSVDATEAECCRDVAGQLSVRMPKLCRSPLVSSPFLIGIREPVVMLPEDTSDLPLRDVFIHELAHLKRHDVHWLLLRQVCQAVLFFQPLLWWLGREMEGAAEDVCDDHVLQLGGSRLDFAESLVGIAALSTTPLPTGVGMISRRSLLEQRVLRIIDESRSVSTRVGRLLLIIVLLSGIAGTLIVGLVGLSSETAHAEADDPPVPRSEQESRNSALPESPAAPSPKPTATTENSSPIHGMVVGHDRKVAPKANVYWFRTRVNDLAPMRPKLLATTDDRGHFSFTPPTPANVSEETASWMMREHVVVVAPGYAYTTLSPISLRAQLNGTNHNPGIPGLNAKGRAIVIAPPAGEPLRGRLVTIDGQPVVGATVRIRHAIHIRDNLPLASFDATPFPSGQLPPPGPVQGETKSVAPSLDWRERLSSLIARIEPVPQRYAFPSTTTNERGEFQLPNIGVDRLVQLLAEGDNIESTEIIAANRKLDKIELSADRRQIHRPMTIHGNDFLLAVGPSVPVQGRVFDIDTGEPIVGAFVRPCRAAGRMIGNRGDEHFMARTDAAGRYKITGLPTSENNTLLAFTMGDIAYVPVGRYVDTSQAAEVADTDMGLKVGVWAEGRVFDAVSGKPFTGNVNYYWFHNEELEAAVPGLKYSDMADGLYYTNSRGEFRVPVLPSRGILAYRYDGVPFARRADGIDNFPRGLGADAIGDKNIYYTMPGSIIPSNYNFVAVVHPKPGDKRVRIDMPMAASPSVRLQVVVPGGDVTELPKLEVYGLNDRWGWQEKSPRELIVEDLLGDEKRKVFVYLRGAGLAGAAVVDRNSNQPVSIKLAPSGSISGRLVDEEGEPITDATLVRGSYYPNAGNDARHGTWAKHPGKRVSPTRIPVDEQGRFKITGLIPGWHYSARVSALRMVRNQMGNKFLGQAFVNETVEPGEARELGDLVIRRRE